MRRGLVAQQRRSKWWRHFFRRQESVKTTWKLRLALLMLMTLLIYGAYRTRAVWILWMGQSLVCAETIGQSDLILVENFDPDYLVYERAAALHHAGFAARVLIPIQVSPKPGPPDEGPYAMAMGLAELTSRLMGIDDPKILPIRAIEPISLNAAYQLRDYLTQEHLRSVIVVSPAFRSMRSYLVHQAVLAPVGITVHCVPDSRLETRENWTESWHDLEEITQQSLKLLFYRFYVLRHRLP
jgi:hypothetical protein